ncbi:MAG: Ig-like domain-containing protein, partial [Gemmatimonadota bacterium]
MHAQERLPYSLEQLVQMVESGVFSDQRILMLVRESCIGFRMDEEATQRLSEAGASEGLIASLRRVCVNLPRVVTTVVVSPEELEVPVGASRILRAQALDPDSAQIAGVVFEWSSEDTVVAEVSMGGVVLGKALGETRVVAGTEEGPAGVALVRVVGAAAAEAGPAELEMVGERRAGKSVATAAALGVLVPGGGEFYAGKTAKGAVVLLGAAASLAAGYVISSEEVLDVSYTASGVESCDAASGSCTYPVTRDEEVEETRQIVIGAAAAGAFWLYGLIDGIRSARAYESAPSE